MAKISSAMREKLAEWDSKGYCVQEASVRFIVAWKAKDAPSEKAESAVILPDIRMVQLR